MIFDAANAYDKIDIVYDAEYMRALDYVKWVDDVAMTYCLYLLPPRVDALTGELATTIIQAKKIEVMLPLRMIVINPIEGMNYGNAEEKSSLERVVARIQQFGRGTRPKSR